MKKRPFEKFETKLQRLLSSNTNVQKSRNTIKIGSKVFFKFTREKISYGKFRYSPNRLEQINEYGISCEIIFSDLMVKELNSNLLNPPQEIDKIYSNIKKVFPGEIKSITIGGITNSYDAVNKNLIIGENTYILFKKILKEETRKKIEKIQERFSTFFSSRFGINLQINENNLDYKVLLQEIIEGGYIGSEDIKSIVGDINVGEDINYVLKKTISKQTSWLIDNIQEIIDAGKLNRLKAKDLGNSLFGYSKGSIKGPEHLMEKILTQYGKNVIFGIPILLSMKKYVINNVDNGLSNSQFDIILINHLSEIEIVELKRPDVFVLDYDSSRGKFYPSKDLSIAISQSERYITLVYKDNDSDFLIDGKKLREYINDEIGGMHVDYESCRPTALIIIGSCNTIAKPYEELSNKEKEKVDKASYERNRDFAYKELINSFKNIKISTYSDLLDIARTRLAIDVEA